MHLQGKEYHLGENKINHLYVNLKKQELQDKENTLSTCILHQKARSES